VLLELAGGYLKDATGTKVSNSSGLLVLVASTQDDSFTPITSDCVFIAGQAIASGSDDVVLWTHSISGDGNSNGSAEAGEFRQPVSVTLSDTMPAGAPLRLYWFPSLSPSATSAASGVAYGAYRSTTAAGATDSDGSEAWVLPADCTLGHELLFLTSDAGSSLHTAASGADYGMPDSIVGAGTSSSSDTVTSSTSTFAATSSAETISNTLATLRARLAALRKQLATARQITDPAERRQRIHEIRSSILEIRKTINTATK
jgi:hypothetical protein